MDKKIGKLLKSKQGIKLDLGCGGKKQAGFVGMDIRKLPTVDIVHDAEVVPYPIPDESCLIVLMSHMMEHMCPKKVFGIMNELWRIVKPDGQLWLSMPYAHSHGFWQDPTHCHSWNETTAVYFDPHPKIFSGERSLYYDIYKPKPWQIIQNDWNEVGSLTVVLQKRLTDSLTVEEKQKYGKK
jgi:SAM-dependent methyltransferase